MSGPLERTEHRPWPLRGARVEIERNELPTPHGLACDGDPAHLHFSRRLDVVVLNPERVAG